MEFSLQDTTASRTAWGNVSWLAAHEVSARVRRSHQPRQSVSYCKSPRGRTPEGTRTSVTSRWRRRGWTRPQTLDLTPYTLHLGP